MESFLSETAWAWYTTNIKCAKEKMRMNDYLVNVCGDSSNATWLIRGSKHVLYEAGMAYSADKMIEKIKKELNGAPLDAVILSHSHYDHVAGLPFIKKEWPDAVVYGSPYAAKILEKPSVRATMQRLSADAAKGAGVALPEYDEDEIHIDVTVEDGDVLQIGDTRLQVIETPGHTKCSLSFLVNEDILLASETIGVWKGGWYMPCYLVGYQMCLDAVERLRRLPAKRLFISHMGILAEEPLEESWAFVEQKLRETKEEIKGIIASCETEEGRLQMMKERYHDGMVDEKEQPSFAFLLNAAATLHVIEQECMME